MAQPKQVKVSERAFHMLKTMAKTSDEFKGRGVIGVVDKLLFGEFTTEGSGRPHGAKNKQPTDGQKS